MSLLLGPPKLFGEPDVIGAESGNVSVQLIKKGEADRIIREGHYSHSVSWSSNLHLGVYVDGVPYGAMQFGPAMNPASGAKVVAGSTTETWLELNRLWLRDDKPPNTTSRAISCALKVVRHRKPAVEWIQSFADERCGKLGAVYQACSFLYCGEHIATFYELDGEWFHKSMLSRRPVDKRGWRSGPKVAWFKQNQERAIPHTFRQFRYVKFLRPRARQRLLLPVLPYPKPDWGATRTGERPNASGTKDGYGSRRQCADQAVPFLKPNEVWEYSFEPHDRGALRPPNVLYG